MRVTCHLLRHLRANRTIIALAREAGISDGNLSRIERGVEFPLDKHIPGLERAYGAPVHEWYAPGLLLLLQADEQ